MKVGGIMLCSPLNCRNISNNIGEQNYMAIPTIVQATWRDLGYRSIGPADPLDPDQKLMAKSLGDVLETHAGYEVQRDEKSVWIRDPGRAKKNHSLPAARIRATLDASTYSNEGQLEFIKEVQGTLYREFEMGPGLGSKTVPTLLSEFSKSPQSPSGVYSLALAFAKCPLPELSEFLSGTFFRTFFEAYPNGKALLIQHNPLFERRAGTVRAGYTMQQYGRLDGLNLQSFETMSHWQNLVPSTQLRMILDLGAIAFLPTIQYFTALRMGITLVLIPGQLVQYESLDFPSSWHSVYQSHWDFAKEHRSAAVIGNTAGVKGSYRALQHFIQAPNFSTSDTELWVGWLLERFNFLQFHQSDPAEFEDQGRVDFVTCLEHALSVDRLLRKGVGAAVSVETAVRKAAAMEIADLLEELSNYWKSTGRKGGVDFKTLFHSRDGLLTLTRAFGTMPNVIRKNLVDAAEAVYTHVHETIVNSVFVDSKRTPAGNVLVRDKKLSTEKEETPAEFVANVVRCLRNTHHGYLTKRDTKSLRPSRYLALVSGNLPNTFQYLGTLFALAFVADPKTMIGWECLPVGAFE